MGRTANAHAVDRPLPLSERKIIARRAAQELRRGDVVNRVYPAAELLGSTLAFAAQMATRAPLPLALAKEAIHVGLERDFAAGLEAEAQAAARCCVTPEQRAAVAAFLARRADKDRRRTGG